MFQYMIVYANAHAIIHSAYNSTCDSMKGLGVCLRVHGGYSYGRGIQELGGQGRELNQRMYIIIYANKTY